MRLKLDLKQLVAVIRGDQYTRMMSAKGEDFIYVICHQSIQLWRYQLIHVFEKWGGYLNVHFGLDLNHNHTDVSIELVSNEPVMIQYTLLDVLFTCLVSPRREEIFKDNRQICQLTVYYQPRIAPLGGMGERHLSNWCDWHGQASRVFKGPLTVVTCLVELKQGWETSRLNFQLAVIFLISVCLALIEWSPFDKACHICVLVPKPVSILCFSWKKKIAHHVRFQSPKFFWATLSWWCEGDRW